MPLSEKGRFIKYLPLLHPFSGKRFTGRSICPALFDKSCGFSSKAPIYKNAAAWYDDFGSFPISHPFGPRGNDAVRLFFMRNMCENTQNI
jgi:hypothetical protein